MWRRIRKRMMKMRRKHKKEKQWEEGYEEWRNEEVGAILSSLLK